MKIIHSDHVVINYAIGWEDDDGLFVSLAGFLVQSDAKEYVKSLGGTHYNGKPIVIREVVA